MQGGQRHASAVAEVGVDEGGAAVGFSFAATFGGFFPVGGTDGSLGKTRVAVPAISAATIGTSAARAQANTPRRRFVSLAVEIPVALPR